MSLETQTILSICDIFPLRQVAAKVFRSHRKLMAIVLGSMGQEGSIKLGGCVLSQPATKVTAQWLDSRTSLSWL